MVRTEGPDRILIDGFILDCHNECFGIALNRFYVLCFFLGEGDETPTGCYSQAPG